VLERQLFHRLSDFERGDTVKQRLEHNLKFKPRQRLAKALMDAVRKGHMMAGVAENIEFVRLLKNRRVAVGGVADGCGEDGRGAGSAPDVDVPLPHE